MSGCELLVVVFGATELPHAHYDQDRRDDECDQSSALIEQVVEIDQRPQQDDRAEKDHQAPAAGLPVRALLPVSIPLHRIRHGGGS